MTTNAQRQHCFTSEYYNEAVQHDAQYVRNQAELESFTKHFTEIAQVQRQGNTVIYIIPVVFHILHNYGNENITDAQVYDAMEWLNRDFRRLNPDTADVIAPFKSNIADCEIEFRLATKDPNGNCTNGIEHLPTLKTYSADDNSKTDPSWTVWPNNKYLNIWVANSLANQAAAAYAKLPGGSNSTDGIMCRNNYVGSIGTSNQTNARTLTHEVGHHFNLLHVWGNTNSPGVACGDDGVNDTPISFGWDHCNLNGSVCDTNIIENVQNYMEYSYCDVMFTNGQKVRMHASLASGISGRSNLWQSANLVATGTDGTPPVACIPKADFKSQYIATCAGTSVRFTDQSWKAPVTSWSWSFPGGNPSSSIDSFPQVVYANAGLYDVTLVVTNSAGSDSITKTSFIRISGPATKAMPYMEDFEDPTSFPGADGWVENPDNGSTWTRVINASASTGIASIRMNNYNTAVGSIDEWVSPSIDFSNVSYPVQVRFKVSNAQRSSATNDQLLLLYSLNCGQTWNGTTYLPSGANLSTAGIVTGNFSPTSAAQWRQDSAFVNPAALKPNVRFKFKNLSDHGNNTYVDDIYIIGNITAVDDVNDLQSGFTLYPNPSHGNTTISFALSKGGDVNIEVKNILGQSVMTILQESLKAGMHEQLIPVLSSGIYFVDVRVNNKHHVRKLIVE